MRRSLASVITTSTIKRYSLPQAVIQVVHELNANALVDAPHIARAHLGDPDRHGVLLVFGVNSDRGALWYLIASVHVAGCAQQQCG